MTVPVCVVLTLFSPHVRTMVRDAGRAYVDGARPPAVSLARPALSTTSLARHLRRPVLREQDGGRDLLVIGDTPAETLTISGSWTHEGDILVINDGVVKAIDADFTLDGNLWAMDHAVVTIANSSLTLDQHYLYEYAIYAGGAALFSMDAGSVSANRYPYSFGIMDSASVSIDSVHYKDFTTYSLFGSPVFDARSINLAGEFVVMDRARCTFVDVDTVLVWCSMMDSAVVDYTFPSEGPVYGWRFDSTQPGIIGVDYSVVCDSVYHPWWGMFSGSGSNVTIRDSQMRSCGIFFEGATTDTISTLVDGSDYGDVTLPFDDRTLRFVNTEVTTISFYPWQSAQVYFSSCILGEVLSMDQSLAFGTQYYLDGSGGHLEANGQAGNVAVLAMLTADVLARDQGFVVLAACAQLWGQNWAEAQSRLFMVQTMTPSLPVAFDGAVVGYEFVTGPASAVADAQVAILGSVWVDCGPDTSVDLAGYAVFHELADGARILIGAGLTEVRDDTLAVWDTTGLDIGTHVIVVEFWDTLGDTLEGFSLIRLDEAAGAAPATCSLLMLDVGPAPSGVRLTVTAPANDPVRLGIYDLAGRCLGEPLSGVVATGSTTVYFDRRQAGAYVARLTTRTGEVTRLFTITP